MSISILTWCHPKTSVLNIKGFYMYVKIQRHNPFFKVVIFSKSKHHYYSNNLGYFHYISFFYRASSMQHQPILITGMIEGHVQGFFWEHWGIVYWHLQSLLKKDYTKLTLIKTNCAKKIHKKCLIRLFVKE